MQVTVIDLVILIAGVAIGAVAVWLAMKNQSAALARTADADRLGRVMLTEQLAGARRELSMLEARLTESLNQARVLQSAQDAAIAQIAELSERARRVAQIETELKESRATAQSFNDELTAIKTRLAAREQELASERTQSQEKLVLLEQARQSLSDQFKSLAAEILDEKSRKFTEQNQTNLDQLLSPLKQQLTDFKSKVEEVYVSEGKDRSALTEQVRQLMALNQTLSQDANNLTLALKGDRKAQGNWGEIILDDVLERSGLLRDQHYQRQGSVKSEDGQTQVIPDVVIHLPGDRHLVVDSKLTLPDYRAFASADSGDDRALALKRHLLSIRNHMRGLSEKNYQSLYGLRSLDFVVMFVPLEPAFMLAVTHDQELFQQAWEKNVLLVSPSTLLFVIRTVANLWRQEDLSRNAKAISSRGADLYDKLVGFVTDLNKVGTSLAQAQGHYDEAKKKLSEGNGNLIRQAEKLKKLGVKPSKQLPKHWSSDIDGESMSPQLPLDDSAGNDSPID